jgi:hypothetical protein
MVTPALSGRSHEIFINRKMIVHLVDGTYELFRHRVKSFASRGFTILLFADVNAK